ncbi:MAG: histidine kinase dimerization/phospho-acceptor domain-containing protein, partial [Bacteriovorax sp.]
MPKDLPAEDIRQVYNSYCDDLLRRIDNMFVFLLLIEWVLAILLASLGTSPSIHGHSSIYVAIAAGALLALGPFYLVRRNLGAKINRYVITISQVLFSILLIFLTGERIETHFLVFISISFVSFYADWHLIVLGTALVMLDHLILGIHWSVAEHMAWLLFLDAVLIYYIKERKKMLWSIALKEVSLQRAMDSSEQKSQKRTWELQESINVILEQQQSLVASAKMSTLGEMSAGIAHEINNPLTIIIGKTSRLKKRLEANVVDREELLVALTQIVETSNRIV